MTENTLSVCQKLVPNIINSTRNLTLCLKKEEEKNITAQVGKIYRLVDETKNSIWYCPKCNSKVRLDNFSEINKNYYCNCVINDIVKHLHFHDQYEQDDPRYNLTDKDMIDFGWKPIKVKILSIHEIKLLDITNADAERLVGKGFKYPKKVLFKDFYDCYNKIDRTGLHMRKWNPKVFLIGFEIIK